MSRAFVREDDARSTEVELPEDETPAPVTTRGYDALRARLARLREDPARVVVADHLARRLDRLTPLDVRPDDPARVAFGATVTVEDDDGERTTWRIVGPDELDLFDGAVSVSSPVARSLLGRSVGDTVRLQRPRGRREVTVIDVRYE
jgi:transcription elongation factor GreB